MRIPVVCLFLLLGTPGLSAQGSVMISEFMASNSLVLLDQDGDASDWIEIHNPGTTTANLSGMTLSDDPANPGKWTIPFPTFIAAGGTIVVFASGKDRAVPGQQLHTNFKLTSGGEYLALFAPGGAVLTEFAPQFPQQFTDVSYGFSFNPAPTATEVYFTVPTPGAPNGFGGSVVSTLDHQPAAPQDSDDIVVTAQVANAPGATTTAMQLHYRVMFGAEVTLTMVDDGTGFDLVAGDGIWTTGVPAAASTEGDMVRWRVTASDSLGGPAFQSPLYLSTTNSPRYLGAMVEDTSVNSQLPVLSWFIQSPSQATSSGGTRCAVWYAGELYDNILIRPRGGSSLSYPKKSFKLDFNTGHHAWWDANAPRAEEINVNTTWADKAFMRQPIAYGAYADVGAYTSASFPLRVQQNGQFYSVAIFVEQPDERYLERHGLDPNGALYKMYNTLTSSTSGVEKKTRLFEGNGDLAALVSGITLSGSALEQYLFDSVDVPAVISYLVATCLINDNDHVHKNYYLYRDSDGDGEWAFLPWDKDLTLGRNYTLSGGVLNDTMFANQDPYCHPLFGDQAHPKNDGPWNRLIDACYRNPRIREMYLRRLRTSMDWWLQAPATPQNQLMLEAKVATLQAQMASDVALDQAAWGIPNWGTQSLNFQAAINQMKNAHLIPRRNHLFLTHSSLPGGIIPPVQGASTNLTVGTIEADPISGNPAEEYVQLINCHQEALDVSGWTMIAGSVLFTFPPGTVVASGDAVYVTPDKVAFRARSQGPSGGQGLLVVGSYEGDLLANVPILIYDASSQLRVNGPAFSLTTTGAGDVQLTVLGTAPFAELYIPFSGDTSNPLGCGPVAGLGADALFTLLFPLNSHPVHVLAGPSGNYSFSTPPGIIPAGTGVDARVIAFTPTGITFSPLVRRFF